MGIGVGIVVVKGGVQPAKVNISTRYVKLYYIQMGEY